MITELIQSVNPITPSKGTNAGKAMFLINNKHWSQNNPKDDDTHVCLEEVKEDREGKKFKDKDGKDTSYINVIGFTKDTRTTIADKIKLITEHDAGYSVAIATLLK